jgi:nucleoid-associated protein YgaU
VKYTLFRENGNPVRGTATLTLKELSLAPPGQNPTSGGEPGSRAYSVLAGDTLQSIAYNEFGTAAAWRRIAEANPFIDDPMRVKPGTALVIPPA